MAKNIVKIPKFLCEMKSIWLFLATMLIVTLLFVVFYQPASYMRETEPVSKLNIYIFTVIMVSSGAGMFVISRMLLYYIQRKHSMEFFHYIIWLAVELIVISVLLTVIAFFLGNESNLIFSDMLWHVSLDFLSVIAVPYIISVLIFYLDDRRLQVRSLRKLVDTTAAQLSSESENVNFYDRGGKLSFSTRRSNVLYIEAADNYSNIHYINEGKEDTFILHNSLKQLDDPEKYKGLLRCHRGYMVNIENVKLLRKDKEGLVLELAQGAKSIPVSRTYNHSVVQFFAGDEV